MASNLFFAGFIWDGHRTFLILMSSRRDDVTQLRRWAHEDQGALEELMPLIYKELHKSAKRQMTQQEPGHTLQTTPVIHEAYLRLGGGSDKDRENRASFSSAGPPRPCGMFWSIMRARGGLPNVPARSGSNNSMTAQMPASAICRDHRTGRRTPWALFQLKENKNDHFVSPNREKASLVGQRDAIGPLIFIKALFGLPAA